MKPIIVESKTFIFILLLNIFILAGCSTDSQTTSAAMDNTPVPSATIEPTLQPSSTPTQLPPTDTPLPPTATSTITSTSTSTSTFTPTSEPASLVVNEAAACRQGPGLIYDIRAYLSAGVVPTLLGYVEDKGWWSVEEPEFNRSCWVSAEVVTVAGDVNSLPVFTPEPTPTTPPLPTPDQKGVIYYLIALNTGGPVGCGDSLIPVYTGIPSSGDLDRDIHNSLHTLLKLKVKDFGGLYNPLHNAHLNTGGISFNKTTGQAKVELNGSIPKPKDECEYHRVRGVLWETVRHYKDVKGVTFWIGDKLIGDLIAIIDR